MFSLSNKPVVAYLAYEPYGITYLEQFLDNYKKFNSGYDHELLICFKSFKNIENITHWKNVINKRSINFVDYTDIQEKSDFDINSYLRIAKDYVDRHILFLNTYTKPNCNNWLKIFINHYKNKSIIGATASMASLSSQFLNFFYDKHSKFQQLRWGIKHLIHVKLFPNPHIRTTAFFLSAEDLLSLNYNKIKLTNKIETNYFEAGRYGLSSQLLKKGFELILINSDNKSFQIKEWKNSETFCLGSQKKLIFVDNRTEEYANCSREEREKRTKSCWGEF